MPPLDEFNFIFEHISYGLGLESVYGQLNTLLQKPLINAIYFRLKREYPFTPCFCRKINKCSDQPLCGSLFLKQDIPYNPDNPEDILQGIAD